MSKVCPDEKGNPKCPFGFKARGEAIQCQRCFWDCPYSICPHDRKYFDRLLAECKLCKISCPYLAGSPYLVETQVTAPDIPATGSSKIDPATTMDLPINSGSGAEIATLKDNLIGALMLSRTLQSSLHAHAVALSGEKKNIDDVEILSSSKKQAQLDLVAATKTISGIMGRIRDLEQ